jgi:hypothetical protein
MNPKETTGMNLSLRNKGIFVSGLMIGAAIFGAACSDDPETGNTSEGGGGASMGTGGAGGESTMMSSSTGQSSSTGAGGSGGQGGMGGMGGMGGGSACGDIQTDPKNCGACENLCAPGQMCEAGACKCAVGATATYAEVQAIFTKSCGSSGFCHNKNNPAGGLDLRPGMSYAALVDIATSYCQDGRQRVVPGDPSESYLVDKIMNIQLCNLPNGSKSGKMPPGSNLPAADLQTISNWICGGAQP